jgi:SNF2 family DNA or RNA helicase
LKPRPWIALTASVSKKRCLRISLLPKDSVEEKILDLQRSKQKLFNNLITTEEGFVKSLTKEDILELLA